ncbi:MAG: sigma-70 family RNA polymerase sigma factor [Lachnospiraceae bacterium]|nr:sigma-70 family RNA polymerase sigma factor [Lachnospiraceae bacterium]
MTEFELLLEQVKKSVEYFVKCKVSPAEDAQDVLQETYLTAYQRFDQLKDHGAFKAWILSIARNKCNDHFRQKAAVLEIPMEDGQEYSQGDGRMGIAEVLAVRDNLERLADKEKEILYLYFWKQMLQEVIAKMLDIPVGTVKSRLHAAKQRFRESYEGKAQQRLAGAGMQNGSDLHEERKKHNLQNSALSRQENELEGVNVMKRLPEYMPKYTITARAEEPFAVKWEELMGWFLVPRLGEELSWGMYDQPSGKCDHVYDMKVTGRAKVHGIEGVELTARESSYSEKEEVINRTFVAQLTDTHCRYLATIRNDDGVRNFITFLDGEEFMNCWGFGEDNCGNETNLAPKGDIKREGNVITTAKKDFLLDIVGRYDVTICGKTYDTVCVMDVQTYNNGVVSEQFLDKNGRTILWRRFNKNDWHVEHYGGKLWSEQLPENDRLIVDGETYVQWYDCITEYVL